jgi:hypothetical protein
MVPSISTVVFFEHVAADAVGAVARTVKESADATARAPNFVNFFINISFQGVEAGTAVSYFRVGENYFMAGPKRRFGR